MPQDTETKPNAESTDWSSDAVRPGQTGSRLAEEGWSTVPRHLARQIKERILSGAVGQAGRLPSQRELATDFGVSRASVREALLLLEAAGLVKTEAGRGTYLLSSPDFAPSAVHSFSERRLLAPARTGVIDYSKLDICQFRLVVEGQCARLAAMRITDEQIAQLERNLARFKAQTRARDTEASAATDFEFHQLVVQFARVQLFTDLHLEMRSLVMQAIRIPRSAYARAWEPVLEHERILEAIRRRDPAETRYYMQSHITRSAERLGVLLADDLL